MKKNYLKPAMMVQTIQMGSLLNDDEEDDLDF